MSGKTSDSTESGKPSNSGKPNSAVSRKSAD